MKRSTGPGALARGLGWLVLSGSLSIGLSGCAPRQTDPEEVRPEQAGQPLDPVRTVGRIASAHAAAITGNQDGLQRSMEGFSDDMRRAMKLPDPSQRINPEAAPAAARRGAGVGGGGWVGGLSCPFRRDASIPNPPVPGPGGFRECARWDGWTGTICWCAWSRPTSGHSA